VGHGQEEEEREEEEKDDMLMMMAMMMMMTMTMIIMMVVVTAASGPAAAKASLTMRWVRLSGVEITSAVLPNGCPGPLRTQRQTPSTPELHTESQTPTHDPSTQEP
jgi:hypothetical protein